MEFLSVIVAGIAAFAFGAVWYMSMATPWKEAAGLTDEQVDNSGPIPFLIGFGCCILVAGMMRHVFISSGVDTAKDGLISGLGLGLFIAVPWLATNYAFALRPGKLTLIDGTYSTVGSGIIGLVLGLF